MSNHIIAWILGWLLAVPVASPLPTSPPAADWVCPPCTCPEDSVLHSGPGPCPACGMEMIRRSQMKRVAILIFDGVEPLDLAGPAEVFGASGGVFEVCTVARDTTAVRTSLGGMILQPLRTLATCPPPDVLVIPGGGVGVIERDPQVREWICRTAERAEVVLSVCSGAFVLARAGLLDGLRATAHPADIEELRRAAPKTTVVNDLRYVDNGKIVTAGGVSSGIDAALHVVERMAGKERADRVAGYLQHQRRSR